MNPVVRWTAAGGAAGAVVGASALYVATRINPTTGPPASIPAAGAAVVVLTPAVVGGILLGSAALAGSHSVNPWLVGGIEGTVGALTMIAIAKANGFNVLPPAMLGFVVLGGLGALAAHSSRPPRLVSAHTRAARIAA